MAQKLLLNYVQGELEKGSVLSMNTATPILQVMPFKSIKGNSYTWNVVDTLLSVTDRELGEEVPAGELQSEKVTRPLIISCASAKVDRALSIMEDVTDLLAETQHLEMVSMGRGIETKVIAGLKGFLTNDEAGVKVTGALTTDFMYELEEKVNPTIYFVNDKASRKLRGLLKEEGQQDTIESFGKRVNQFNGVPIHISNDLADNEVMAVRFGEDGVMGITNKGLVTYTTQVGVHNITDTELLWNVICKTKNAFGVGTFTATRSK